MYRGGPYGYTFTPGVYAADTFVLKSIRSEDVLFQRSLDKQ
jgi:hypothetical protein